MPRFSMREPHAAPRIPHIAQAVLAVARTDSATLLFLLITLRALLVMLPMRRIVPILLRVAVTDSAIVHIAAVLTMPIAIAIPRTVIIAAAGDGVIAEAVFALVPIVPAAAPAPSPARVPAALFPARRAAPFNASLPAATRHAQASGAPSPVPVQDLSHGQTGVIP